MREKQQKFLEELYEQNYAHLHRLAFLKLKNNEDAEDMVHEVFMVASNSMDTLMEHENPRAWLFKTLTFRIKNEKRRHARRRNISLEEIGDLAAPEAEEPLEFVLPSDFTDKEKELLTLHIQNRFDYDEIARIMGISELTCRVRLCRLLRKLRKPREE